MKWKMALCLKIVGFLLLLNTLTILVGCTTRFTIDYKFDSTSLSGVNTHPKAIAIAPFLDERPRPERTAWRAMGITRDSDFTGPVSLQIAAAIARHFEHDKLFLCQEVVGGNFMRPTADQLTHLKSMGNDALLIGSISHFYGILVQPSDQRMLIGLSSLFPILLIPAVAAKKPYIGYTELSNLKLLDTNSGRVIWEGRVEGKALKEGGGFETWDKFYSTAFESLKMSVTDLSKELKTASF